MAPRLLRAPQVSLRLLSVMRFWLFMSARALEIIDRDAPELTCSEGLTDCTVSSDLRFMTNQDGTIDVTNVQLKVILCCSATDCEPGLQVLITVQEVDLVKEASDQSGDHSDEVELKHESNGRRKWHSSRAESYGDNQASSQRPKHQQKQLVLTEEKVTLGNPVVVRVSRSNKTEEITIPSLEEVCSMDLNRTLKKCDVPRLRFDHERNVVVVLQRGNSNVTDELMVKNHQTGEVIVWPKDDREIILPSKFVAPCMCFQVWWKKNELRKEYCPFLNRQDVLERMQHKVSVSLKESLQRGGGSVLIWNVTAPCRLNAEVSLCKKDPAGGRCEEVKGFRQELQHNYTGWRKIRSGYWKTDTFNISSHPLLCVQIKIQGIESYLEPQCPFATSRWRWSFPLLIGLLLMSLALLGAYLMQGVLKGYMWRWLKDEDVKGAVGGGHVVLLYPPDDNQALPEMMSHLGSSLLALGFTVSLALWSQTELSVLGPVPWLHSRLNRLQKQGGKVVLVLTQAAWIRAEEWGARSSERNNPHRDIEETGRSYTASSPCVDVFTASLSCILADYLQGRAGERFVLVQFESLPPEPPGGFRPLPELFRGLHVYSLPSQSLGFLTELAGARQMATASARRKRAGGLRMASRALAQGLSGFTAGTTVLRLAGVSQSCVGVGVEDSGETVPLQQCLITPPSSTDSSPKLNAMEWV
ncbi:hypothetical protein KUCAC02_011947 [Chaenocephalus aceratus]|uniref:Uncharacterized protein n=1 Tax=Chaenocephalus aceratus TaxID=36190 RepID=A0ACB9XAF1_CHAAC|nr:hypothetical protein KUCAC02_011947 [Chaenocephalus aceratus]